MSVENKLADIVVVPLSYLEHYHQESKQNTFYSSVEKVNNQAEILSRLKEKGGTGEDQEVSLTRGELKQFQLV